MKPTIERREGSLSLGSQFPSVHLTIICKTKVWCSRGKGNSSFALSHAGNSHDRKVKKICVGKGKVTPVFNYASHHEYAWVS